MRMVRAQIGVLCAIGLIPVRPVHAQEGITVVAGVAAVDDRRDHTSGVNSQGAPWSGDRGGFAPGVAVGIRDQLTDHWFAQLDVHLTANRRWMSTYPNLINFDDLYTVRGDINFRSVASTVGFHFNPSGRVSETIAAGMGVTAGRSVYGSYQVFTFEPTLVSGGGVEVRLTHAVALSPGVQVFVGDKDVLVESSVSLRVRLR